MSFQSTRIRDCAMFCYEQESGMQIWSAAAFFESIVSAVRTTSSVPEGASIERSGPPGPLHELLDARPPLSRAHADLLVDKHTRLEPRILRVETGPRVRIAIGDSDRNSLAPLEGPVHRVVEVRRIVVRLL